MGSWGDVEVSYTTSQGTASSFIDNQQDFKKQTGTLTFHNSESRKTIVIEIINDARAEGPEEFYVNLTSIKLLQPK